MIFVDKTALTVSETLSFEAGMLWSLFPAEDQRAMASTVIFDKAHAWTCD